jgi:hypothetical protein
MTNPHSGQGKPLQPQPASFAGAIAAITLVALALGGCHSHRGNATAEKKEAAAVAPIPAAELNLEPSTMVDPAGKPDGKEAANLDEGRSKIWYADLGDSVALRVQSALPVILHVDFNQSASVEKGIDRSFGVFDNGSVCAQMEHDRSESADCGQTPSAAKGALTKFGDTRDTFFRIPKSELGGNSRAAWVSFEFYDPELEKSSFFPGGALFTQTYKLAYGKAAVFGAPAATPPAPRPTPKIAPRDTHTTPAVPSNQKTGTQANSTPTPSTDSQGPPEIKSFVAEPERINVGESVRLAWSVTSGATVTLNPGIGDVLNTGESTQRPSKTTEYRLEAVGANGAQVSETRRVEVQQRVEIGKFVAVKQIVNLNDTINLRWETTAATKVTLRLNSFPDGARYRFPDTVQEPNGEVEIPVSADQFTRFGMYVFQLTVEGLQGPISRTVTVLLRQK